MKNDIFDVNKFIEINECPEVENPIFLDKSRHPTEDGLFSYSLFGPVGSYDRKTIFGYVDLKHNFLHPVVYKILTTIDRSIVQVISGEKFVSLDENGYLVEDDENGGTGLSFLYKNFYKMDFKKNESRKRNEKIDVFNTVKRTEAFQSKWLVIPAFYRDINMTKSGSGKLSVDEINSLYSKLINLSKSIDQGSDFSFMGNLTEYKLQQTIMDIYNLFKDSVSKKTGIIRQGLMGKAIDYATRGVISANTYDSNSWESSNIKFGYCGVPLSHVINLFFPFFIYHLTGYFEEIFSVTKYIKTKSGKQYMLENPMDDFTPDKFKKLLNLYIKSPDKRFMPIEVNTEKGKKKLNIIVDGEPRIFTLTDLLYIIATKVVEGKHVYVTRYPVETFNNIYPARIKVMTTKEVDKNVEVQNTLFEDYPIITDIAKENEFIDTIVVGNAVLDALGGDYDGDTVSLRAVWSNEANIEAEDTINSLRNFLDPSGNFNRTIGNEAVQTIFTLTKN